MRPVASIHHQLMPGTLSGSSGERASASSERAARPWSCRTWDSWAATSSPPSTRIAVPISRASESRTSLRRPRRRATVLLFAGLRVFEAELLEAVAEGAEGDAEQLRGALLDEASPFQRLHQQAALVVVHQPLEIHAAGRDPLGAR